MIYILLLCLFTDQEADDSQRQEVDELKTRVIQLKGEIRKELEKDVQDSSKDVSRVQQRAT